MSAMSVRPAVRGELPRFLRPPTPSVFTLEITPRCQHRCLGCGNVFDHADQEMDAPSWAEILERLRPHVRALRITGGEPTLHEQFGRIIQLVDGQKVPFVLFTNGNWTDPPSVIETLRRCENLRGILFSLHGGDAASYREFTGVDAFKVVTDNIRMAAEAGLRVATNTLLLTTTFGRLARLVSLALSLGASTVSFGRYYGEPLPGLSLSAGELKTALTQIAELRREEPRVVLSNCVPACFLPDTDYGERGCTSGFTHCTIGPAGEVRPCTHTPLTLGYVQEDDIEVLWHHPLLDAWRRRIPPACLRCAVLSRCRGGCRATAQQLDLACDPLMTAPLTERTRMPVVELAAQDRPRLACSVEPTSYGYALDGTGQFVTLSHRSRPILEVLNGDFTVLEIEERFGPVGLQLVGSLVHRGLVEIAESF